MTEPAPCKRWVAIVTWSDPETGTAREAKIETDGPNYRLYQAMLDANAVPPCGHTTRVQEVPGGG